MNFGLVQKAKNMRLQYNFNKSKDKSLKFDSILFKINSSKINI